MMRSEYMLTKISPYLTITSNRGYLGKYLYKGCHVRCSDCGDLDYLASVLVWLVWLVWPNGG